jgi:hypothetical protein
LVIVAAAAVARAGLGARGPTAACAVGEGVGPMTTCTICGHDPCTNRSFCRTCRDADRRKARGERPLFINRWHRTPEQIPDEWCLMSEGNLLADFMRKRREMVGAPRSVVEAVMYALRTYGADALKRPNVSQWLIELRDDQLREVINRLERLRPQYPAINEKLLSSVRKIL